MVRSHCNLPCPSRAVNVYAFRVVPVAQQQEASPRAFANPANVAGDKYGLLPIQPSPVLQLLFLRNKQKYAAVVFNGLFGCELPSTLDIWALLIQNL